MLDIRSITRKRKLTPDGRRREAKLLNKMEAELTKHVGTPTITQREADTPRGIAQCAAHRR